MYCHVQCRWWLYLLGVLMVGGIATASVVSPAQAAPTAVHTLYAPLILNVTGGQPPVVRDPFQIALVDGAGAWLYGPASATATLLRANLPVTTTVRAAANGQRVALALADGWALFAANGAPVADQLAPGYQLAWDQDPDHLLLSRIGEGIVRLTVATGERTLLLRTTDETNDHSPVWSADGTSLIFAHHEFGEQLFVTQIPSFDLGQLPYIGENRAATKLNPQLMLLQQTTSWYDQPLDFHWSTDGDTLIFAARQQIHLVNVATQQTITIAPPGFATNLATYAVDVVQDQILYTAEAGIFVTNLQGGLGTLVVPGTALRRARWSPGGEQIIYTDAAGVLHLVDASGANGVTVAHTTPIGDFDILSGQ